LIKLEEQGLPTVKKENPQNQADYKGPTVVEEPSESDNYSDWNMDDESAKDD
jgi:hypothetical protein